MRVKIIKFTCQHIVLLLSIMTFFVELAPLMTISDYGLLSWLYCTLAMAHFDLVCNSVEMKTKLMFKAQTLDMMTCRSLGGMPLSA